MIYTKELYLLQKILENEYFLYKRGFISESEYICRAKPVDMAIGNLEMSNLLGTLALKEASSQLPQKQAD